MNNTDNLPIWSYQSKIDPSYTVSILFKTHELYNDIKVQLNNVNNSIAALQIGTKNILIDGEELLKLNLTQNDIYAIEAHEIAHSIIGHGPGTDEESEKEADLLGIALLEINGLIDAAEVLKDKLFRMYNIDYRQFEQEFNSELDTEEFSEE